MRSKRLRRGLAAMGAVVLSLAAVYMTGSRRAYADATAAPSVPPSQCPASQYPPAHYPNPTPSDPNPPGYHGPIPYEVPFTGTIADGQITVPPNIVVPHIYAAICGLVQLPQLSGVILPGDVHFPPNTPNVYVAGLEALPVKVDFTANLIAGIAPTPAPNGGLNISITTSNATTESTLGMSCSVVLDNVTFTTETSGTLTGKPVTGPTEAGQAQAVSNDFPIPAVQPSPSCPPAIAATFNKLLGLPLPAGVGTFVAPFTFVFEIQCPPAPGAPAPPYTCPSRTSS